MTTKKSKSRLFKGSPTQLLLDERVSKIALPTLDDNRAVMDEREANWGLDLVEEDETEVTEKLQIFVGLPTREPPTEWEISEDDDPFWDEDDDPIDEVPMPMALSLNLEQSQTENESVESASVLPAGIPLQPIQEVQDGEADLEEEASDDWGQIQWDDVTLSDILGDMTDLDEDLDDEAGGAVLDLNEPAGESSNEVFPALISLEDIPAWEESWEQDDTDPAGATLNLDDDWFSESDTTTVAPNMNVSTVKTSEPKGLYNPRPQTSYTSSKRPPPPRIVLRKPVGFWQDPIVRIWLMILSVALVAAIIWRILQLV